MNAVLVITMSLVGQCPNVSEYDPPRPDMVALVEVASPPRRPNLGLCGRIGEFERLEQDVTVLTANNGTPAGERITLKTQSQFDRFDEGDRPFEYEPLRVFDNEFPDRSSKCHLPEAKVGERLVVALENGQLVDWHRWEPLEAGDARPRVASSACQAADVLLVRIDGTREGTFSLDDVDIEFEQSATVRAVVRGESYTVGRTMQLGQRGPFRRVVAEGLRPRLRSLVPSAVAADDETHLPADSVGESFLVFVQNDRLLGWQPWPDEADHPAEALHAARLIDERLTAGPFSPDSHATPLVTVGPLDIAIRQLQRESVAIVEVEPVLGRGFHVSGWMWTSQEVTVAEVLYGHLRPGHRMHIEMRAPTFGGWSEGNPEPPAYARIRSLRGQAHDPDPRFDLQLLPLSPTKARYLIRLDGRKLEEWYPVADPDEPPIADEVVGRIAQRLDDSPVTPALAIPAVVEATESAPKRVRTDADREGNAG